MIWSPLAGGVRLQRSFPHPPRTNSLPPSRRTSPASTPTAFRTTPATRPTRTSTRSRSRSSSRRRVKPVRRRSASSARSRSVSEEATSPLSRLRGLLATLTSRLSSSVLPRCVFNLHSSFFFFLTLFLPSSARATHGELRGAQASPQAHPRDPQGDRRAFREQGTLPPLSIHLFLN
jgi:hypothetical protein